MGHISHAPKKPEEEELRDKGEGEGRELRPAVIEQGDREEEEGSEGVGVEDEDEVAHTLGHGSLAHDHQPNLGALGHHHPRRRPRYILHLRRSVQLAPRFSGVAERERERESYKACGWKSAGADKGNLTMASPLTRTHQ